MEGIKDWHLMLIVFGFVLVDVVLLVTYIALEGFITHFSVGTERNEERPSGVHGVSINFYCQFRYMHEVNICCRNWKLRPFMLSQLALQTLGFDVA